MTKQVKNMSQLKDSRLLYDSQMPFFGYMLLFIITFLFTVVIIWSIYTPKIDVIKSTGTVQGMDKNYIMSPFTGVITDMKFIEGANVEKGDVLFSVKSNDLNLQSEQLEGQIKVYENQIKQYEKLVKSIKDDHNYFDSQQSDDNLYYSQFEAYKSQIAQQKVDASSYQAYGYTEEQIKQELIKNQGKTTEIYYTAIKTAEDSILQCKTQLGTAQAQLSAVIGGKQQYQVVANESGRLHLMAEYKDGMVVQAASAIASIVTEQEKYIVKANVSPDNITQIKLGDSVDIAVAGLVQSVYGTVTGKVTKIDSDISTAQSSDGKSTTSYFNVEVTPDYTYLVDKKGDKVNFSNGFQVETRIQYDKVSYFRYVLESLGVLTR